MYPSELNLAPGFWMSATTILSIPLLLFSLRNTTFKMHPADYLIFAFLIWIAVIIFVYPLTNVFYGFLYLVEGILVYFLFRFNIRKVDMKLIRFILLSMLLFQSILCMMQYSLRQNIGLTAESSINSYSSGQVTIEDENVFRATGTYGHANELSVALLFLLPLSFSFPTGLIPSVIWMLGVLSLFLTQSRASWAIGFPVNFILFISWLKSKVSEKIKYFTIAFLIILSVILAPSFISRIQTIPDSLVSVGSGNTRIQLAREAIGLISLSPIFGVGLNRFQEIGVEYASTDIFETNGLTSGTKSHNLLLEMSAELGLAGTIIFLVFIGLITKELIIKSRSYPFAKNLLLAWISLLLISQFHPFLLSSQFRLFFLLAALILV